MGKNWDNETKRSEPAFYNTKMQIFLVLLICLFIGLVLPFVWKLLWVVQNDCCSIESDLRYNCLPHIIKQKQNESICLSLQSQTKHCCWDKFSSPDQIRCYYGIYPEAEIPGYKLKNITDNKARLKIAEESLPHFLKEINCRKHLILEVNYYGMNHVQVVIKKEGSNSNLFDDYISTHTMNRSNESNAQVEWPLETDSRFYFNVTRKSTGTVIFNTIYSPLIYCDQYLEITTLLPNDLTFGLGQAPTEAFKHNFTYPQEWALFSKFHRNLSMDQKSWYGVHPFYLGLENDGRAYGVLFKNVHPTAVITNSRPSLTFRTTGGYMEFHFFMGPEPIEVIRQLMLFLGRPAMPPYWALGFHLCRSTCSLTEANSILKKYQDHQTSIMIPIESDCGSGLLSRTSFEESNVFKDLIHFQMLRNNTYERSMFVHIPQVLARKNQSEDYLFSNDSIYEGKLNNPCHEKQPKQLENVVYYDYFGSNFNFHLEEIFSKILDFSNFGGMILDLNTPLDLKYLEKKQHCKPTASPIKGTDLNYPFINPTEEELFNFTVCMDVESKEKNLKHFNFHNIYGYKHAESIFKFLNEKQSHKRTFVLSLSTFIGIGKIAGHWGGHIPTTWWMLEQTLIQTLEFNLYGIPLVGFPVCGFRGTPSDDELCIRWYQLAAFQPVLMSHRDHGEQFLTDPFSIANNNPKTLQAIRSVLLIRYEFLPFLYTLFYDAHENGRMVIRPLFVEFPKDRKTYNIYKQFLWGSSLMISPVIDYGVKSIEVYFPKGYWYDFYTGKRFYGKGKNQELNALEYQINLHVRGGSVIPTQKVAANTRISRTNNFTLIVALNKTRQAFGQLYIDDGESKAMNDSFILNTIIAKEENNNFLLQIITYNSNFDENLQNVNTMLEKIKFFGIIQSPKNVVINSNYNHTVVFEYKSENGVLTIPVNLNLAENHTIQWQVEKYD